MSWIGKWYQVEGDRVVGEVPTPRPQTQPAIAADRMSPWRQPLLGNIQAAADDGVGEVVSDLADIAQCFQIILNTPKGSDPHRPDFASNLFSYLDWPIQKATPHIVRESLRSILTWEPRVELIRIGVKHPMPEVALGNKIVELTWRLKEKERAGQSITTDIPLGAGYRLPA